MSQDIFNNNIEKRMERIEQSMDKFSSKLDKIYDKLLGDDLNPKGLLEKIDILEHKIAELEDFKKRIMVTIALCGSIGGILGYILNLLITLIK